MLKLLEVIPIKKEDLSKYKLHLAINPGGKTEDDPFDALFRGEFKDWQEWQKRKNFERDYILSLIDYHRPDEWVFGGVYKRKSVQKEEGHYKYHTELLDFKKDLIGRLIIFFRRPGRQSYLNLEKWADKLKVVEISRKPYTVKEFRGYEEVLIDFDLLKIIIDREEPSWKTALSAVKGVYIITDKSNGKIYVGSAYGEDSFWNRWCLYAKNGHGGNKELKRIIGEKGLEYASNFQFSILEVVKPPATEEEVRQRESHWKNVLKSREFGYNEN